MYIYYIFYIYFFQNSMPIDGLMASQKYREIMEDRLWCDHGTYIVS